jgi:nitroreductase
LPYIGEEELRQAAQGEGGKERTVEDVVLSRHSIRRFQDRPVSDDTLLKLFSLSQRAPSDWNLQPWRWLVLREREDRDRLQKLVRGETLVLKAPIAIIALANTREWEHATEHMREHIESGRFTEEQAQAKVKLINDAFRDNVDRAREFAVKNTMLALMTLCLVAQGEGLGTGFLGDFDEESIRQEFEVPDDWAVAAVLTLGYPAEDPPKSLRKPLGDIVQWDKIGGKRTSTE